MATTELAFDRGSDLHDPALYQPDALAEGVDTFDQITDAHLEFYREQGYLVVRQAFTPDEVRHAIEGLVDLIMDDPASHPGVQLEFEARARDLLPTLTADQRQDAVRKLMWFTGCDDRLKAVSHHSKLIAAVRRLLGGSEPAMFQDMALVKPPRLGREKPWHQDKAYFDYPLGTPVVGVWIALDEATVENGCMQFLPGRHREGPLVHFQRRDWQICDRDMLGRHSVAAPLAPGGLLFFDGLLPHGTPHNRSPKRRRALQFHYAPAGVAKNATSAERLAAFGSEGKNVSC